MINNLLIAIISAILFILNFIHFTEYLFCNNMVQIFIHMSNTLIWVYIFIIYVNKLVYQNERR